MNDTGVTVSATGPWSAADAGMLSAAVLEQERIIRRAMAAQGEIVAAVESRGARAVFGYPTTVAWLKDLLHLGARDTRARVTRAVATNPSHTITGTPLPASTPVLAAAATEGALGTGQIDAVLTCLNALPASVRPEDRDGAEKILVDLARTTGPRAILLAGRRILSRLDTDGPEPAEVELATPHREFRIRDKRNGWITVTGELDPESGAALKALLSPLSAPRPALDGTPDTRTFDERMGDALAEAISLAACSDRQPTEAGERPTVVVTLDYDTIAQQIRAARLDHVGTITPSQARRIACDATLIPVVLGSQSEPLDVGRRQRLVTPAIRRALTLRDKGCAFPACERPPQHCQAHHLVQWVNGGRTSLDNLVLVCGFHHRLLHHTPWEVRLDEHHIPTFIPPDYLDPRRQPRYNPIHRT